ncbi:MAG: CHAT domain-containing protein, partial [Acidimicrobiia bacterium]|nr:CHAT domain-containing protein [Acidimicrobiia bacterium]
HSGDRAEGMVTEAEEIASQLDDAGQSIPATGCWLLAGRLALEAGALRAAERSFARLERYRNRGPIELRVQAWLAAALLRGAKGDSRGADAAARAGARTISSFQSVLGATDVRVGVAQYGVELNELGMRLALDSKRPRRVWEWMERTRAGAARIRAVVPAMDDELTRNVAALRRITAELRDATPASSLGLVRRQAGLQEAIRSRARTLSGSGQVDMGGSMFEEVRGQLGNATLIEMALVDGRLWAVVLDGSASLHRLGSLSDIEFELSSLRATLRRVAGRGLDDVAANTIAHISGQLNLMLLPSNLDATEVVVVPPAQLHAVPWSMLPQLSSSSVSVAPSAEQWLNAKRRAGSGEGVLIAAGPGLAHADAEVHDLLNIYPKAAVYASEDSDVDAVLQDLDGARVAHIACHGTFQFENPMFSALQLAAGDLVTYDIERLDAAPAVVVLSSCDAGLSAARPGDELMGLTSAMLSAGTSSLIASIGLVPDTTATRQFMLALHDKMRSGSPPAVALAAAQREAAGDTAAALAAASFVCFGS